nr:RNA-directed DNA polymerase, eukaryota [Tanacetum cinerariifolium]
RTHNIDGFNNLVEGIWKEYQSKELNPIRFFIGKLKVLKRKISEWNNSRRSADISLFSKLKLDLESIDEIIDRGDENDEIMCKRSGIINNLNDLSNIQTMETPKKLISRWNFPTFCHGKTESLSNERLVSVIKGLINEVQSAFIVERQILDGPFILNEVIQWYGPFILNEVIQWCKLKKNQILISKVDFEKAYDAVRWDFLDEVLRKFGFGDKWCKWIQCCLKSSRGSILVNGSPTKEFAFGRGFKQGDPLSSFLFILIMESLHLSFTRVVNACLFKGINIGDGSVNLSHLFYADDAVFVGQWSDS